MEIVLRQSSTTRSFSGGKADIVIYQNGQNVYFSIRQSASPGMGNVHSSNAFSLGFKVYHVLGHMANSNQTPMCEGPGDSTCLT